jgi:hypothetical protein
MKELERLMNELVTMVYTNGRLEIDKHHGTDRYKQAILRMFEEKDKRIAELEAQVEKLKCCGNCTSFMIDDHHVLYCQNDVYPFPILGKCDRWEASHDQIRKINHQKLA